MESTQSSEKLQTVRDGEHKNEFRKKYFFSTFRAGQDIVHTIERVQTTTDDEPVISVVISGCGDIKVEKPFYISDNPYNIMGWVKAAFIPLTMSFTILLIFQYFIKKLDKFEKGEVDKTE